MFIGLGVEIGIIIIASALLYYIGNYFAASSSKLGDYMHLPRDVKGATMDAIASSLPEVLVALYSVIFFAEFGMGIGTLAGSTLFNLLVIPGICVFVSPVVFRVSKKIITRDAFFYVISLVTLIILLYYFKVWGLLISLVLLGIYAIYIIQIASHTREHRKTNKQSKESKQISLGKELTIFFVALVLIGVTTFFLTKSAINLSSILGIPSIIVALTIVSAATSIPDTIISVANAKKGDVDDATSNVFGSNIFDILIGLGLPLLIYSIFIGPLTIVFGHLEIIIGLLLATLLAIYFFITDDKLSKIEGLILLSLYVIFIIYTIILSLV